MQINNESGLSINIPQTLKQQIDFEFQDLTATHLNKIYFLVHRINKETQYQVNITNHVYMFGFKNSQLTLILSRLSENLNIIKIVKQAKIGHNAHTYAMVQPFAQSATDFKLHYYPSSMKLPVWVQKFFADGYMAANEKKRLFQRSPAEKQPRAKKASSTDKEIEALKREIERLRGIIAANNYEFPAEAITVDDAISMGEIDVMNDIMVAVEQTPLPAKNVAPVALNEADALTVTDDEGITTTVLNFNDYRASAPNGLPASINKQLSTLYSQKYNVVTIGDWKNGKTLRFAKEIMTANSYQLTFLEAV